MYIYLDETFNLKKGSKKQFLAIAGFSTLDSKKLAKRYYQIKSSKLPRKLIGREVKSTDRLAEKLIKPYLFKELLNFDVSIYCALQYKNQLPLKYFIKSKLNYDSFYLDLLEDLLVNQWNFLDHKIIIIALDTFKTKKIDKGVIIQTLCQKLKSRYSNKIFEIKFENSSGLLNLEIADFICGIFQDYSHGKFEWRDLLKPIIKKVKINPLN